MISQNCIGKIIERSSFMTRLKSIEELKSEYIGKVYGFLTVINVYRDTKYNK